MMINAIDHLIFVWDHPQKFHEHRLFFSLFYRKKKMTLYAIPRWRHKTQLFYKHVVTIRVYV